MALQTATRATGPRGLTPVAGGGIRLSPTGPLPAQPAGPADPYGADPTGVAGKQADQLANPTNVEIKTAPNPFQTQAFGDVTNFANSLADRSNASITNAMQRQRDVGAAAQADVAAQAGRRGGAPGSGLAGVLGQRQAAETQRQVAKTNADLTDVALNRETQARALEMGGATDIARDQSDMFGKQSDLYLGTRRADLGQADLYARERDARFRRAAEIAALALDSGVSPGDVMGGGAPRGSISVGGVGRTVPTLGGGIGGRTAGTGSTSVGTRAAGGVTYPATYSDFGQGHPYAGGVR